MSKIFFSASIVIISTVVSFSQGNTYNSTFDSKLWVEVQNILLDEEHCEVPCGIYGDSLRVSLIKEHISTIEKAMDQIEALSKEATPNYNQLVRWVTNKEKHAEEIQQIVSQYFLHQRVKMPKADLGKKELHKENEKYFGLLSSLHAVSLYAMKCKQSTDQTQIANISKAVEAFEGWYFHGHQH